MNEEERKRQEEERKRLMDGVRKHGKTLPPPVVKAILKELDIGGHVAPFLPSLSKAHDQIEAQQKRMGGEASDALEEIRKKWWPLGDKDIRRALDDG